MEPPTQADAALLNLAEHFKQVLLSYFYWTYARGSFHYDIMVTLILLFIFVTPFFWNYGDKPSPTGGPPHLIQVIGNDGQGVIVTVPASDVNLDLHTTRYGCRGKEGTPQSH